MLRFGPKPQHLHFLWFSKNTFGVSHPSCQSFPATPFILSVIRISENGISLLGDHFTYCKVFSSRALGVASMEACA